MKFKKQNKQAKEKKERERQTERQKSNSLLTIENKLLVTRGEAGGGWVKQVMGSRNALVMMGEV